MTIREKAHSQEWLGDLKVAATEMGPAPACLLLAVL